MQPNKIHISELLKQKSILCVLSIIVLDIMSWGVFIPILPHLISLYISNPLTMTDYYGYFIILFSILQFLASPFFGVLSDRFGRRKIFLISLFGSFCSFLIMLYSKDIFWLFIGRALSGLSGSSLAVAFAYMSDLSSAKDRPIYFGLLESAEGLGLILGPAIGGIFAHFGVHVILWIILSINFINFMSSLFFLSESLPKKNRSAHIEWGSINHFKTLIFLFSNKKIYKLVFVFFCVSICNQVIEVNWSLFTAKKFNWSSSQIGFSFFLFGICSILAQILLVKYLMKHIKLNKIFSFSLLIQAVTYFLLGCAPTSWMLYPILIILSLSVYMSLPLLISFISEKLPQNVQGELHGGLAAIISLSSIIAPCLFTYLFAYFTYDVHTSFYLPGISYILCGFLCLLGLFFKKHSW